MAHTGLTSNVNTILNRYSIIRDSITHSAKQFRIKNKRAGECNVLKGLLKCATVNNFKSIAVTYKSCC